MECIGNSDALYHNIEHTMLVTLAAQSILSGRSSAYPSVGRGLRPRPDRLPRPRHRLCARAVRGGRRRRLRDRRGRHQDLAAARCIGREPDDVSRRPLEAVCDAAAPAHSRRRSGTYRPRHRGDAVSRARKGQDYDDEASILRAADFIGQLGDPNYLRKANALYYEFEEVGINRQLGYDSPADIVNRYPQFYWNSVAPHIQTEIGYLNKTEIGRQWIANLYSNVFRAERDISLSGPQQYQVARWSVAEWRAYPYAIPALRHSTPQANMQHKTITTDVLDIAYLEYRCSLAAGPASWVTAFPMT